MIIKCNSCLCTYLHNRTDHSVHTPFHKLSWIDIPLFSTSKRRLSSKTLLNMGTLPYNNITQVCHFISSNVFTTCVMLLFSYVTMPVVFVSRLTDTCFLTVSQHVWDNSIFRQCSICQHSYYTCYAWRNMKY